MKITSLDKEIKQIFESGYYEIPRFQRPYSWEKDHVYDFWNDTIIESDTDYFIGSIVVYKKTKELFGIVDGQQRLTTITMLLCAVRNFYLSEGFESQAKGVHSLIETADLDNNKTYILQTETSYPYFQEHIQKFDEPEEEPGFSEEEENLKNAFAQLEAYISGNIKSIYKDKPKDEKTQKESILLFLNKIRDKALSLKVIYIELDDEDDAYLIFETLNTRGKDLAVADLLKNYITRNIKLKNENVDLPKDKWNKIRANIESINTAEVDIDSFLLHHWLSKYENATKKTLFKKIKLRIKTSAVSLFLNELVASSNVYKYIFDPNSRTWIKNDLPLQSSLVALQNFRVAQQTPMVLATFRAYETKKIKFRHIKTILESIEHFHYMFNAITSQRSSGSIASIYSGYARAILEVTTEKDAGDLVADFKTKLREKMPTIDEFVSGFKGLKFTDEFTKQKKIIQYTLSKIDESENKSGVNVNYYKMTIEHIHAQKSKIKLVNHDKFVGAMGNLILLNERSNGDLGNKEFKDKIVKIKSYGIYINPVLDKSVDWSDTEIEARTEVLAQIAYKKVFKI